MDPNQQASRHSPGDYVSQPDYAKLANLLGAVLGARAARNHFQQDGDAVNAAKVGVGAFVRWMVWMTVLFLWIFGTIVATWSYGSYLPEFLALLIAPFTLGVTWCRIIDYGLYRRGMIYRLYSPVARMVEWVPTWALYLLLLIPITL